MNKTLKEPNHKTYRITIPDITIPIMQKDNNYINLADTLYEKLKDINTEIQQIKQFIDDHKKHHHQINNSKSVWRDQICSVRKFHKIKERNDIFQYKQLFSDQKEEQILELKTCLEYIRYHMGVNPQKEPSTLAYEIIDKYKKLQEENQDLSESLLSQTQENNHLQKMNDLIKSCNISKETFIILLLWGFRIALNIDPEDPKWKEAVLKINNMKIKFQNS